MDVARFESLLTALLPNDSDDPVVLRRTIADLQHQLAGRPTPQRIVERVEVPVVPPALVQQLAEVRGQVATLSAQVQAVNAAVEQAPRGGGFPASGIGRARAGGGAGSPPGTPARGPPSAEGRRAVGNPLPCPPTADDERKEPATDGLAPLRKGERELLETLARYAPLRLTRTQLLTLAGYSRKSGTMDGYLRNLSKRGLLAMTREAVTLTGAGFTCLGRTPPVVPQDPAATLALWRNALDPGPRRVLDALITVYPAGLTHDEWADRAEFSAPAAPSTATFNYCDGMA